MSPGGPPRLDRAAPTWSTEAAASGAAEYEHGCMGIDRSSGQPDEEPDRPREEPRPSDKTWLKLVHTWVRQRQRDLKLGSLIRLSGQLPFETDGLGEDAILVLRAEAGCEVGIERGALVTEYCGRQEGR